MVCESHFKQLLNHRPASTELDIESNTAAYLKTFIITLFSAALSDNALVQYTVPSSYIASFVFYCQINGFI